MRILLTILMFALAPVAVRADEKKDEKPADLPVKAKLVAKMMTYTLDLGGKSGDEFRQLVKDAEKSGRMVPPPPAVDVVLEITNTSDKDIKIWNSGTPVQLNLTLTGPGALEARPRVAFPAIFIVPKAVDLAPGKSVSIPITKLQYGRRNMEKMAYWTAPGEYKLTASYNTGLQPAPKDTRENMGFGQVTITSEPIIIKVETGK